MYAALFAVLVEAEEPAVDAAAAADDDSDTDDDGLELENSSGEIFVVATRKALYSCRCSLCVMTILVYWLSMITGQHHICKQRLSLAGPQYVLAP